jgi:uncharacterized damage-inducible protein DinB
MTPEDIRVLYEYDAWANHRILDATAALTPEQFTQPMNSSFSSVRDTLAHIMFGQWIWLERWQGRMPTALPAAEGFPDLASLRKRWAEVEADLLAFVRALTAERIAEVSEYKTRTAGTFTSPLGHVLLHLVNHGTYHRGQVTTLLRQLGGKSVSTDLSLFYRERGAAAAAR